MNKQYWAKLFLSEAFHLSKQQITTVGHNIDCDSRSFAGAVICVSCLVLVFIPLFSTKPWAEYLSFHGLGKFHITAIKALEKVKKNKSVHKLGITQAYLPPL